MTEYARPEDLRTAVRAFLEEVSTPADVRRAMESPDGFDRTTWKRLATDLQAQGLHIPVRFGGAGGSFRNTLAVFEETGRALACAPLMATVALAVNVLLCSGDEERCRALLPRIAAGELIATVAFTEDSGRWDEDGVRATAARRGESWLLNGDKSFVLDGHVADVILVAARMGDGISIFEVDADAAGLSRRALTTMDQTRTMARLELAGAHGRLVGAKGGGWPTLRRALDLAIAALAAEQVGGAQRCVEMAVEHAKTRRQFGRPIGSFQAVKHQCADMLLSLESARSAAAVAATAAATAISVGLDGRADLAAKRSAFDELSVASSLAKAYCSDAFVRIAAANVHIHGALGCTWDHDAHLFLKRAKSSQILFGDATFYRNQLAAHLGI